MWISKTKYHELINRITDLENSNRRRIEKKEDGEERLYYGPQGRQRSQRQALFMHFWQEKTGKPGQWQEKTGKPGQWHKSVNKEEGITVTEMLCRLLNDLGYAYTPKSTTPGKIEKLKKTNKRSK